MEDIFSTRNNDGNNFRLEIMTKTIKTVIILVLGTKNKIGEERNQKSSHKELYD